MTSAYHPPRCYRQGMRPTGGVSQWQTTRLNGDSKQSKWITRDLTIPRDGHLLCHKYIQNENQQQILRKIRPIKNINMIALPGCMSSWKDMNFEFLVISWDLQGRNWHGVFDDLYALTPGLGITLNRVSAIIDSRIFDCLPSQKYEKIPENERVGKKNKCILPLIFSLIDSPIRAWLGTKIVRDSSNSCHRRHVPPFQILKAEKTRKHRRRWKSVWWLLPSPQVYNRCCRPTNTASII